MEPALAAGLAAMAPNRCGHGGGDDAE